jgi:hypothetical protein
VVVGPGSAMYESRRLGQASYPRSRHIGIHRQLDSIGCNIEILGGLKPLPQRETAAPVRIDGGSFPLHCSSVVNGPSFLLQMVDSHGMRFQMRTPANESSVCVLIFAGMSVVQMARCVKTDKEYAIKLFVSYDAFLYERNVCHVDRFNSIKQGLAHELRLPQRLLVADGESSTFKDGRGRAMPPCIVTECAESLHLWAKRTHPDVLTAFAVRLCCCFHVTCIAVYS